MRAPVSAPTAIAAFLVAATFVACGREPQAREPTERPAAPPTRIVPVNTAAAEFLAALLGSEGAQRLAALPEQVDGYSSFDFRSEPWSKLPRFSRYAPEPLIAIHPDLVVTHEWQAAETTQVLRAQGVRVLVLRSARSYDDVRGTLGMLGEELGLAEEAARLAAELDRRIAKLREGAGARANLRALEYTNNGTGGWTAGMETTADTLIQLTGMRNAAAEAGIHGHAAFQVERLIALDPDVIVVGSPARDEVGSATKHVLESTAELAGLSAVRNHRIAVLPAALLSSDSPRLVDAAERLAGEVDAMLAGRFGPANR